MNESEGVNILMKLIERNFPVVMFVFLYFPVFCKWNVRFFLHFELSKEKGKGKNVLLISDRVLIVTG